MFSYNEVTGKVRKDYDCMNYREREELKTDAWQRYSEAKDPEEKADAVEDVISAHFERSGEAYHGKHPEFSIYACHWLAANTEHFKFDEAVAAILRKRYPRPRSPRIEPGHTYWKSPVQAKGDAAARKRREF
jgi:hypothetical protein